MIIVHNSDGFVVVSAVTTTTYWVANFAVLEEEGASHLPKCLRVCLVSWVTETPSSRRKSAVCRRARVHVRNGWAKKRSRTKKQVHIRSAFFAALASTRPPAASDRSTPLLRRTSCATLP